jgi:ferric-dicitrate binding protein FerR (iron transport regulator)
MSDLTEFERIQLVDYIAGECTVEQALVIERWIADHPEHRHLVDALRASRRTMQSGLPVSDHAEFSLRLGRTSEWLAAETGARVASSPEVSSHSAGLDDATRRIAEHSRHRTPELSRRWRRTSDGMVRGLAAVAATVAAVAALFVVVTHASRHRELTRVYRTEARQRATIQLASARVTLAPMSTMRVTGTTVQLDGEAFFEVAGRSATPFIVRTANIDTRVLGTAFDVSRYAGDAETRVTVTSGKVSVGVVAAHDEPARSAVVVTSGAWARVSDSIALVQTSPSPSDPNDWVNGQLRFHKAPVAEVLRTIGRWYDLEFRLADSTLARQHVTVTFDETSPASGLALLETLLDVSTTSDGNVITFRPRQTVRRVAPPRDTHELFPPMTTEVGR